MFVDEGAPMARLIARLTTAQRTGQDTPRPAVPPGYLDRLARAFQPGGAPAARLAAGAAGLVEPLSDRELQVPRLRAAGRSNRQIADELVVVDTVKKHIGHILDKLGAANRTQAVTRARVLGFLR